MTTIELLKKFLNCYFTEKTPLRILELLTEDVHCYGIAAGVEVENLEDGRKILSSDEYQEYMGYQLTVLREKRISDECAMIVYTLSHQTVTIQYRLTGHSRLTSEGRKLYFLNFCMENARQTLTMFDDLAHAKRDAKARGLINDLFPGGAMGGYMEPGFPFYFINEAMLKCLGYSSEQEFVSDIGGMVDNCIHPEDRAAVEKGVYSQIRENGGYMVDYRMRKKDGNYIWVHDMGRKFKAEDGRDAIISACCDITPEKEHERFLDGLVANLNGDLAMLAVDLEHRRTIPVYVSADMGSKQGLSRERYLGQYSENGMDSIYAGDHERVWNSIIDAIEHDKAAAISFRIVTAEGQTKWMNASFSRNGESGGMPVIQALFTASTIQNELQMHALSQEGVGVAIIDTDSHELYYANDALFHMLCIDTMDYTGRQCSDVFHGCGKSCGECQLRAAFCEAALDNTILLKGRWFSAHTACQKWNGKQVACVYLRDVTRQHLLEQKVQESNKELRQLLSNISCGISVCTHDEKNGFAVKYVNDGFCRIFEGTRESLIGFNGEKLYAGLEPQDIERVTAFIKKIAKGPCKEEITYRYKTLKGSSIWLTVKQNVIADGNGGFISYATYLDVTEQMTAKQRLMDLTENVPGGICMYRWNGDVLEPIIISGQIMPLFGLSENSEELQCAAAYEKIVHPDDLPALYQSLLAERAHPNTKFGHTYRIWNQALCEYRWINLETIMALQRDETKILYAVYTDINKAKELEQSLKQEEEMLRCACDFAHIWTWVYDIPGNRILPSVQLQRDFDMPQILENFPESWFAMGFVQPDYIELHRQKIQAIKNGGSHEEFEIKIKHKDGSVHYSRVLLNRLQGNPNLAICSAQLIDNEKVLKARLDLENKRILSSEHGLRGYVVTNISKNAVVERDVTRADAHRATIGLSIEQAVENALPDIMESDRERYRAIHDRNMLLEAYRQGQTSFEFEGHRIAPDGAFYWIRSALNLVQDPTTDDIYLYEYLYDIHALKMAEEITVASAKFGYERVASVNLRANQMTVIDLKDANDPQSLAIWDYTKLAAEYVETAVVEAEKQEVLSKLALDFIQKELTDRNTFEFIHHVTEPDGSVGCRRTRFSYYNRAIGACLMTRTDITKVMQQEERRAQQLAMALKQAREALEAKEKLEHDSELLCAALFNLVPMVISANVTKNYYSMLNYDHFTTKKAPYSGTYEELISVGVSTVPDDQKERFEKAFCKENVLRAYGQGEKSILLEHQQMGDDGVLRWIETRCIFVKDEKSGDLHTITLAQDVTKRKQEQLDLQNALEAAKDATRAKSEFLSRMSHEIRTPMNAIMGMTEIAKENRSDFQQVAECLDKIDMSSHFLLTLINDILEMSRIESGRMEIKHSEFSFDFLISSIRTVVEPLALKSGIRYDFINNAKTDSSYIGDAMRIQQVVVNIVTNAIKFTKPGGRVRLSVSIENETEAQSSLRFSIADTGIGMSEKFMQRMFQPFTQEDGGTTSKFGGSGLGLAISKRLVEAMGGTIQAESFIGVGSTFTICLPLDRMRVIPPANEAEPSGIKRSVNFEKLRGRQVLMAEDHPLNVMVARKILEHKGILVTIAENGQLAVDIFKNSRLHFFDAILMDIRMPAMDGWDAARAIRALNRPDAATVPIIAMTANALEEDRRRSREAGMNAHLAKPFEPIQLYSVLEAQIEKAASKGEADV